MIKVRCPICAQEMHGQTAAEWPDYPFCSPRCQLVDLGRWLGEKYRLPSQAPEENPELEDDANP